MTYAANQDPTANQLVGPKTPVASFTNAAAITKSDTADLSPYCNAIFVGGAGNIALIPLSATTDTPVTFTGLVAGQVLNVATRRVMSTNTTATAMLALYL